MGANAIGAHLARLLDQQAGTLTRAQAADHGCTRSALDARLRSGRWQQVRPRVYAAFTGPLPRRSQLWAAVLYAGPGAVLWGPSAAEVDGLATRAAVTTIWLSVPADLRVRRHRVTAGSVVAGDSVAGASIVVRRSRRHVKAARPQLNPPRTHIDETVLDLVAQAASAGEALAVVADACQRRLTTPRRLLRLCQDRRNLRWRAEVLPALGDVARGAHSLLELRYLREVERAHGLPAGRRQRAVRRGSAREWIDVSYEEFATLVELDGRLGHEGAGTWRDMRRDNASVVAGEAPLRYGWADVTGRPCAVAAELATVLAARGWTGRPRHCVNGCTL